MRVLVCGGRDYSDVLTLNTWLDDIHRRDGISFLIEGGAHGADSMARKFAEGRGIPIETFKADWEKHGLSAGPIRNQKMLEEGKPDLVVAFPGSDGTADMVKRARQAAVRVIEIEESRWD